MWLIFDNVNVKYKFTDRKFEDAYSFKLVLKDLRDCYVQHDHNTRPDVKLTRRTVDSRTFSQLCEYTKLKWQLKFPVAWFRTGIGRRISTIMNEVHRSEVDVY